jgi:hypothetical protein
VEHPCVFIGSLVHRHLPSNGAYAAGVPGVQPHRRPTVLRVSSVQTRMEPLGFPKRCPSQPELHTEAS